MKNIKSKKYIGIFCGSKIGKKKIYKKETEMIINSLARNGYNFIYGGGKIGLMGTIYETVNKYKVNIIGIIPESLNVKNIRQKDTKNLIVVKNMNKRKNLLINKSDILLILPGAYGTLDELFEILTLNQLKINNKPVIIINIEKYWNPLKKLLNNMYEEGFLSKNDLNKIKWLNKSNNVLKEVKKLI
tara:strand:+ start:3167 stop:3727 length:561 start_codon:yes stop_codon:yes gene_type:complete